jgi:pyruvate,water dikinase
VSRARGACGNSSLASRPGVTDAMAGAKYIRWFDELGLGDVQLVGGKNASLGELYRALRPQRVRVPNGFAITADAYRDLLTAAAAWDRLHAILDPLVPSNVEDLAARARQARDLVYTAPLSGELQDEILTAYHRLHDEYGPDLTIAVRSSATAEDLPSASFAGQHETYLNIKGDAALLEACRRCFASLFTDRAIHYRHDRGFDHFSLGLSIGVMKMVRADLASAGVMFSLDTDSGFRDVVFITGAYGLGENVVQGAVGPDEFYVHKPTYLQGYHAVLRRRLGEKKIRMVYATGGGRESTRNLPTPQADRERFCLTDAEVLALADYAIKVERHYSAQAGHPVPMDMEWAKDGLDGELYLLQARPETVISQRPVERVEEFELSGTGPVLVTGRAVGERVAAGAARLVRDVTDLRAFQDREVLVADTTTPDWEPVMKRASGIVTSRGGRTCHAAIVARELGIPAVVGAAGATERIATGQVITVSCAEGETGRIYDGRIPFDVRSINVADLPRSITSIMVNLGNPDLAFRTRAIPNDGVGLARLEFIISEEIKAHPMALVHPERVTDPREREALASLTKHDASPAEYFVRKLSEGVGTIAAAFFPKPVIVRLSDFKTNEYASLLGGRAFEPVESNPMIGFRGASRYAHPAYQEGFALECAALRRVREDMGLRNVILMVPFCRRVDEGRHVIDVMAAHGLKRGEHGLEIYCMCEIPNNVVQVDAFSTIFDGFSIGSNDLTQLVLGVDRDSELVAFDFDERDPGVKEMLRQAVEGARRNGRHSGICGQAPSDYPEIAEYLVQLGIDSMSLNPDTVVKTTLRVLALERALGRTRRSV